MKIGFKGLDLPEGKIKYKDQILDSLAKKDNSKKVTPFFAEFIKGEFNQVDAIIISQKQVLDLLVLDMEKVESRISRTSDQNEKNLMEKCQKILESEQPLYNNIFTEEEHKLLISMSFLSYKPVIVINEAENFTTNDIIETAIDKAGYTFFYTSAPKEAHSWLVKKDSDIVTCASKIHSDLARGFIRAEVVSAEDYLKYHDFNECHKKGVSSLVNKDYIVKPNDVIKIRFNV